MLHSLLILQICCSLTVVLIAVSLLCRCIGKIFKIKYNDLFGVVSVALYILKRTNAGIFSISSELLCTLRFIQHTVLPYDNRGCLIAVKIQ